MKSVVFFVSAGAGKGKGLSGDELSVGEDIVPGEDSAARLDMGAEGGKVGALDEPGV